MFYFDKGNPEVLFCDIRSGIEETLCDGRSLVIDPDLVADVTDLPFDDCTFPLVVFDPPHLTRGNGWQVQKYGKLPREWEGFIASAFSECWRVLAVNGTLVFKWNEYHIALSEVLKLAPAKPVFGNRMPGRSKTHWLVFFKGGNMDERNDG